VEYRNQRYWLGAPASDTLNNHPYKYYFAYDTSNRFYGSEKRFPQDGDWINFYETAENRVASTWQIKNGVCEGTATQYRLDGSRWSAYEFRGGLLDGFVRYWNAAGRLVLEQQYQASLNNWMWFENRTGTWRIWNDQGVLLEKEHYDDNEKQGLQEYFYDNGGVRHTCYYTRGLRDSTWTWYHPNGRLQKQLTYTSGISNDQLPLREYHANGRLAAIGNWIEGEKKDLWTYYYDNGARESEGFYTRYVYNHEHGDFVFWVKTGTWTYWYKNGRIKARGTHDPTAVDYSIGSNYPEAARSSRIGAWTYYNQKGRKLDQVRFEATEQISDE
jgi:antitoxin component YwqK of YwqJK toxin-antitoxin module